MKKQKDHQKQIMHFSDKNMQKVGDEMRQIKHVRKYLVQYLVWYLV